MNSLAKLSLVIPTYDRQQYALRNMRFWSNRGPEIHVLDGSAVPVHDELLSSVGPNIHYHHWPISMISRISKVREVLTTPYTALMGDDEFYLPSGLIDAIEMLNTDKELVSVMGRRLIFNPIGDKIYSKLFYDPQKGRKVNQETPSERMLYHLSNYTPSTIYSVVRTDIWRKAWESSVCKEFNALGQLEIQFELSICCLGKSLVIPSLVWLRSQENSTVESRDKSLQIKEGTHISDWWGKPENKKEREEMLDIMEVTLSSKSNPYLRESLVTAIDAYCENIKKKESEKVRYRNSLNYRFMSFRKRIIDFFPINLTKLKQTNLGYLLRRSWHDTSVTLYSGAKELEKTGVSVNWNEILEIEHLIITFHKSLKSNSFNIFMNTTNS